MLTVIQGLLNELSSALFLFSGSNQLPICALKQNIFYSQNPNSTANNNDDNKCSDAISLNWELKSSEKQPFDIRLSFQSPQLQPWWTHLESLCDHLIKVCLLWLAQAKVDTQLKSVDLCLHRHTVMQSLLSACDSQPNRQRASPSITCKSAVILQIVSTNEQTPNYFTQKRFDLVTTIIANLFEHHASVDSVRTVSGDTFGNFATRFNDADYYHSAAQLALSLPNSVSPDEANSVTAKRALRLATLIHAYLTGDLGLHVHGDGDDDAADVGSTLAVIIIVAAESEFAQVQLAVRCLRQWCWQQSPVVIFKVVKVARVRIDQTPRIDSWQDYRDWLTLGHQSILADVSPPENQQTIAHTMLTLLLLTPKVSSPICKCIHYRNESIFVQYNVARIKSIQHKYRCEYSDLIGPLDQADHLSYHLLVNDHEWNLTLVNLVRMQQLTRSLLHQLVNTDNCDFECHKLVDHLHKVARAFSVYYRNVKILTEPMDHLKTAIKTRVKFCEILLRQISSYFALFEVSTAEQM